MRITSTIFLSAILLQTASPAAWAQSPFDAPAGDPFGAPATGSDPFGAAAPPTTTTTAPRSAKLAVEDDPAVRAILEKQPSTPAELMSTVEAMMNLGREDQAIAFLKRLVAANLDDKALAALESQFGPPLFFRLMRDKTYAPEGEKFGIAVIQAAARVARDPSRLRDLLNKAVADDPVERTNAIVELKIAGPPAAAVLVQALGDPDRRRDHSAIADGLVQMGQEAEAPVMGALLSPDEAVRARAIEVLGRMRVERATRFFVAPYLDPNSSSELRESARSALQRTVGALPTNSEGRVYLARLIDRMEQGELPGAVGLDNSVEVWQWDADKRMPVPMRVPVDVARLVEAGNLANDLLRIAPEQTEYRRLALTTQFRAEKSLFGVDQPLRQGPGTAFDAAAKAGVAAVEDVLVHAMKDDDPIAASAAAEVLGEIGTADLLRSEGGQLSPLSQALVKPSRRLNFTAMDAILKLNPREAFAGAGFLVDALARFAATDGVPRALIGHPRPDEARTLAAMLEYLGFETGTFTDGRELFLAAARNADCNLVLVADSLNRPDVSELVQMFRKDGRTAKLPIGVLARFGDGKRAEWIAENDPLTVAFNSPLDQVAMQRRVAMLEEIAGQHAISSDERIAQAMSALEWIARLAESEREYPFYDLLRTATAAEFSLRTPELAPEAARVLGLLATPRAQQALVDVASQPAIPLAQRQAAATAFETAVKRRGLRLTNDSVLAQYDRYNASETLDQQTQQMLGSVLDTIEAADLQAKAP